MQKPQGISIVENEVILEFKCPMCSKMHAIKVDKINFQKIINYYNGIGYAQDLPLSVKDREKLISGYCDECQDILFNPNFEEDEE